MRKKFNKYKYVALSSMILMPISGVVNAVDTATNEETKVENPEAPSIDANKKNDLQEVVDNTQKVLPETKPLSLVKTTKKVTPFTEAGTVYNWGGVNATLDENGTLTVDGGEMINPGSLYDLVGWGTSSKIDKVIFKAPIKLKGSAFGMFMTGGNNIISTIEGLNKLDTSEVTDMGRMFYDLSSILDLDLSNFDTSQVTDMSEMFYGCSIISELNLSSFNTSKVTTMNSMFNGCGSLSGLDLSNFNTSQVTDMKYMFARAQSIKELDLSNFDTSKVQDMKHIFTIMLSLEKLDISNFSNEADIIFDAKHDMFGHSTELKEIKIGNRFNFANSAPNNNSGIPEILETDIYTGYWQNVGSGTVDTPNGSNVWTSTELMDHDFKSSGADTYVWQKRSAPVAADVTVKYVDEAGNKIAADSTISGKHGDTFAADPIAITGYTFKEAKDGISSGSFTDQPQTITFIYKKNPIIKGDVTIKHIDSEGNLIADNINLNDEVGKAFTLPEPQKVKGYSFKEVVKTSIEPVLAKLSANTLAATTGIFTSAPQEYSFVYTKDPVEVAKETPNIKKDTVVSKTTTIVKNKESKLPQTDENQNLSAVLSILGLGIIAGISFRKFVFKEVK